MIDAFAPIRARSFGARSAPAMPTGTAIEMPSAIA